MHELTTAARRDGSCGGMPGSGLRQPMRQPKATAVAGENETGGVQQRVFTHAPHDGRSAVVMVHASGESGAAVDDLAALAVAGGVGATVVGAALAEGGATAGGDASSCAHARTTSIVAARRATFIGRSSYRKARPPVVLRG